jgi:hypothetical protein
MPMIYKAVKNFTIGRMVVSAGELYTNGDIEELLSKGLIKQEEQQLKDELTVPPPLLPEPEKKKSKKKKE